MIPGQPSQCTVRCPAIRDDKGSFYCRIKWECVAPSEHHAEYGFDIVSEGKIKHSGYSTYCNALELFSHTPSTTEAPEQGKEPMYSALERLDLKFTELIGAIEERQVDGMLSDKDHSDYELVCYCRQFIRDEIKATRARPAQKISKCGCDGCPKDTEHLDCPMPGHCDQMKCPICTGQSDFPTLPQEIAKYEAAAAAKERERIIAKINKAQTLYPHYRKNPGDRGTMDKSCWLTREIVDVIKSIDDISTTTPEAKRE